MHTLEAIQTRRAVRGYDKFTPEPEPRRMNCWSLALLAPPFNLQHVRLVEVGDPALRAQIRAVGWDQAQITEASMLVVICAQPVALEAQMPARAGVRRMRSGVHGRCH